MKWSDMSYNNTLLLLFGFWCDWNFKHIFLHKFSLYRCGFVSLLLSHLSEFSLQAKRHLMVVFCHSKMPLLFSRNYKFVPHLCERAWNVFFFSCFSFFFSFVGCDTVLHSLLFYCFNNFPNADRCCLYFPLRNTNTIEQEFAWQCGSVEMQGIKEAICSSRIRTIANGICWIHLLSTLPQFFLFVLAYVRFHLLFNSSEKYVPHK